jgi:hypothetical protein
MAAGRAKVAAVRMASAVREVRIFMENSWYFEKATVGQAVSGVFCP